MTNEELLEHAEEYFEKAYNAEDPKTATAALTVSLAATNIVLARKAMPLTYQAKLEQKIKSKQS